MRQPPRPAVRAHPASAGPRRWAPSLLALLLAGCPEADPEPPPGASPSPPTIESATIDPSEGDTLTAFRCQPVGLVDPDDDLTEVDVTWQIDGADVADLPNPLLRDTAERGRALTCRVDARDAGGRRASATSGPLIVGNAPPELQAEGGTWREDSLVDLPVTTADADADLVALEAQGLPGGASFEDQGDGTGRLLWLTDAWSAGSWDVQVTATDGEDATTATITLTIDDVDVAPGIVSDCDAVAEPGVEIRCALQAEDPDGTAIDGWVLLDGPPGAALDGDELVWLPTDADGGHWSVRLGASSGGLQGTADFDWFVPVRVTLATAEIEPDVGGELIGDATGLGSGLASATLQIAPGVFAEPTTVELSALLGAPWAADDAAAVDITASSELQGLALLTLEYAEGYESELFAGEQRATRLFHYDAASQTWEPQPGSVVDTAARTVTAALPHFSAWWATTEAEAALTQAAGFFADNPDRSEPGAPRLRPLGDDLPWVSGADNVLLIHGWGGSPAALAAEQALGAWARRAHPDLDNPDGNPLVDDGGSQPRVLYYRYPSGRTITQNARLLRQRLDRWKQEHPATDTAGIRFSVLGHSVGGVLARLHLGLDHPAEPDATRWGLSQIRDVVSIHSPHLGVDPRGFLSEVAHGNGDGLELDRADFGRVCDHVDLYDCLGPGTCSLDATDACGPVDDAEGARERLRCEIDQGWFDEADPTAARRKRRLHSGLKQLLAGMNHFPLGGNLLAARRGRMHCLGGSLGPGLVPELDPSGLVGLCEPPDPEGAFGAGDLFAPLASQLATPFGLASPALGLCGGGTAELPQALHDDAPKLAVWPPWWGSWADGPASTASQWCQDGGDVGDELKCWLGVGGPSCGGDDACGPPTASAFALDDLPLGDSDGDGALLYDAADADPAWAAANPRDCDDTQPLAHPGGSEACDGSDSDCNGQLDDGLGCLLDGDGDGFAPYGGDCDDDDPDRFPGADEGPCNSVDDDCDGAVDEGLGCADDADGDSFTIYDGDCDDGDGDVFPGAPEQCNGADDDCDGLPELDEADDDADGWMPCTGDCDDGDDSVFPGALEACDEVDSDCDGDLDDGGGDFDGDAIMDCMDDDADGDGDPNETDCADLNAAVFTGAPESCDAVDSNCDGSLVDGFDDFDSDGQPDCVDDDDDDDGDPDGSDCAELDPAVYTGAPESCDAVDSNCDGSLVDGFDDLDGDGDPDCVDPDVDGDGDPNESDCDDGDGAVFTGATELCDALDSNCDGSLVDGFDDWDGDNLPDCVDTDDDNDNDPDTSDCAPTDPSRHHGAAEVCNGLDEDCDGVPDNGALLTFWLDADGDGYGDASASTIGCEPPPDHVDNDDDCDDDAFWIAPGLSMVGLVELYSAADMDHLSTRLNEAEHTGLTSSGQYCDLPVSQPDCDGTPHILGYVIDTFPFHLRGADAQTPGGAADLADWVPVQRAASSNWDDHITHGEAGPPSSAGTHGHNCFQNCPAYAADSLYLGWIPAAELTGSTRPWYRVYRPSRRDHRMTESDSERDALVVGAWSDDGSPGWIFNGSTSCP